MLFRSGNQFHHWYEGVYAEDAWRATSRVTVNAGIRWEPYKPSIDTAHRGSHFDYNAFLANQHSAIYPNAPAGLFYYGDKGVPAAFANNRWMQFSPRTW